MMERRVGLRALRTTLMAAFLVVGISAPGQATPLDVNLQPYPVIMAGFIGSTYNALTGTFAANGWTLTLDTGPGQQTFRQTFQLLANINNQGVASGGSLSIGVAGSYLASTSLIAFGFDSVSGGTLEFLFAPVSGSMVTSGLYNPLKPIDVMINGFGTKFPGNFTNSWSSTSNTGQIKVDPPAIQAVAEPSTLMLMLCGGAGLLSLRRRRQVGAEQC